MNQELNLLPFNLEEALKSPERVVYRNGEKPLEWHWLRWVNENEEPIVSVRKNGTVMQHYIGGRFYSNINCDSDLLLLPEKRYWVNVYKDAVGDISWGKAYTTELEATTAANKIIHATFIKTISFTA